MKKKIITCTLFMTIVCIAGLFSIHCLEKQKNKDLRIVSVQHKEKKAEKQREEKSNQAVMVGQYLQLELLSYEWVEYTELAKQKKYPEKYFIEEKYPTINPDIPGKYLFFKCNITNACDNAVYTYPDICIYTQDKDNNLQFSETVVYFDKVEDLEGEERMHSFNWYHFQAGEVLECVLGYRVRDFENCDKNPQYYIGSQPEGLEEYTPEALKDYIIPLN